MIHAAFPRQPIRLARRSGLRRLFILALTSYGSRPHVAVIRTALGHELPRVRVVAVPRLLASVQRARVGVRLRLEVEDGVDRVLGAAVAYSNHNRVLVRTHDVGDVTQHNQSLNR